MHLQHLVYFTIQLYQILVTEPLFQWRPVEAGDIPPVLYQMADNDPDASDADKGIDNFSEYGRGDPVVDHKAEKCSGKHRDNAGAHHGEVRHIEPAEEETDHKDHNIVYAEECLDSCQVFLFAFGGRQKVEGCGGTAGGEEPVADAADDAEDRTGYRIGRYVDLVREHKEENRDSHEHDTQ